MFNVHIPIRRRHQYFSYNVFGLMFIISTLAFSSFALPEWDLANRSAIVLTLLLTAVATKFVIADRLPKVHYFTTADLYFSGCFITLATVMLAHVIAVIVPSDDQEHVDRTALHIIGALWLFFLVAFSAMVVLYNKRVMETLGDEMNEALTERRQPFQQEKMLPCPRRTHETDSAQGWSRPSETVGGTTKRI